MTDGEKKPREACTFEPCGRPRNPKTGLCLAHTRQAKRGRPLAPLIKGKWFAHIAEKDPARLAAIASKAGLRAHITGKAHEWNSATARAAALARKTPGRPRKETP